MTAGIWQARSKQQAQKPLTEKELAGYRQWLAELAEEAAEPGGDPTTCDREVAEYFSLKTSCGKQVYESFSDAELLEIVIKLIDHHGHKLNYANVYCIYKTYLRKRFGNLPDVASKARTELKLRKNKERWPPDWQERVSLQALLDAPRNRRSSPRQADLEFLNRLCEASKRSGYPPNLTGTERQRISRMGLGSLKFVLETMGIPCLDKIELRHIKRYWDEERKKSAGQPIEEDVEHE